MAEFYEFITGTETLRFTPSVKQKTTSFGTFIPTSVRRLGLVLDENPLKASVTFSFPITNLFALKCLRAEVPDKILVNIYVDTVLIWSGRVIAAKLKNVGIDLQCEASISIGATGLGGARFSLYCWKSLYSQNCGLLRENFSWTYTSYTLAQKVISVNTATAENFFLGGIAQIGTEQRYITASTGTTITLADRFSDVVTGDLTLTRGCSLTRASCLSFGNLTNFGGFSYIATKSLNSGQSVAG